MSSPFDVFGSLDDAGCYRSGNLVVLPAGGELPLRCVVCNAPCDARREIKACRGEGRELPPGLALMANLGHAVSRSGSLRLAAGICDVHARRSRRDRQIAVGCLVAALPFFATPALSPESYGIFLALPAFALLLVAAVYASRSMVLRVSHTDHRNTYLRCGVPFLLSLPEPAPQIPAYGSGHPGYGGQMAPSGYNMPIHGPGWFVPPQGGFGGR